MSEYQYYEFLAVDRPLDERQQAEVRALSTRARITATSFTNEYHWGNFRGDPRTMLERYYDAQSLCHQLGHSPGDAPPAPRTPEPGGRRAILHRPPRGRLGLGRKPHPRPDQRRRKRGLGRRCRGFPIGHRGRPRRTRRRGPAFPIPGLAGGLRNLGTRRGRLRLRRRRRTRATGARRPGSPHRTTARPGRFLRLDADLLTIAAQASPPLAETKDDPRKLAR
jgi:hypothetical protein